jgi:hypothetical protein
MGGGSLLGRCAGCRGSLLLKLLLGLDPFVVGALLGAFRLASIAGGTGSELALNAGNLQPLTGIARRL